MTTARVDKVIATNFGALRAKYGTGLAQIRAALAALVAADKARAIATRVIALDHAGAMAKVAGRAVTSASSPRQNKTAIDAIYRALTPDYLCLLGSVDVIPHQDLLNPALGDGDALAPSDLPYACNHAYSDKVANFMQPTRVVGRLPDLTGGRDPAYLVKLLDTAATASSLPASKYEAYLGLTTIAWHASTHLSLANIFGNATDLHKVPPKGPPWRSIGRLAHFINCHGSTADFHFYGKRGKKFTIAHDATKLRGVKPGTVVSAECCYGAELYDPAHTQGQAGICNTYLGLGAHAFFGSSTIAYGPNSGNSQADLICQYFLQHVFAGASVGEAALLARLSFIKQMSVAAPTDLKTLAQFNLMADPSVHPVAAPPLGHHDSIMAGKHATASKRASASKSKTAAPDLDMRTASRAQRRRHLAALGSVLSSAVATVETDSRHAATGGIAKLLQRELHSQGAEDHSICAYALNPPEAVEMSERLGLAAIKTPAATQARRIYTAIGRLPKGQHPFDRYCAIVAHEMERGLALERLYSR
ncbi:MAG: hypothetical protein ACREPT_05035 [Rudaea sp.]